MAELRRQAFALLAVAAFTGCPSGGGNGGGGSNPTIITFTATPDSLPVAGGSATLAWSVTGASSLSIDHGVGAVTPITTGSTSVQVTSTTTFTLTATDSNGSSTQTADVTVATTITVNGTVTDEFGTPAPGETVLITSGSFSQSVTSDANGAFSVPNVPAPYAATILDSGGRLAVQYQGLTRADPSLFALIAGTPPRTANVSGQLTGGTLPLPSDYRATVEFVSPQTGLANSPLLVLTAGSFSGSVHWSGPATTTGTLYALEIHNDAGLPMDYPGYGTSSNVLLQDIGVLSDQNFALGTVTTSTLSGSATAPAGFTLAGKELFFQPAPGALFTIVDETSADASFSYTTPDVSDATFTLLVLSRGMSTSEESILKKGGLAANATGLNLTLQAPPTLSLPLNSATGVTVTTPFSWANFTGVYLLIFSGGGPTYIVFTSATTATIPDLSSHGLSLPASTSYEWEVYGFGPATSTDSLAVPGGLLNLLFLQDGYTGLSETRAFTTSP
jgi:hypothetical protein